MRALLAKTDEHAATYAGAAFIAVTARRELQELMASSRTPKALYE
jgi:hypothetical protein